MSNPDKTNEKLLKTTTKETDVSSVTEIQKIKSPIDILKPSYIEKIKEYKKELCNLQFRKKFLIDLSERYKYPSKVYSYTELYEKTFETILIEDKISLELIGNFNVIDGRKIIEQFNDDSKQEDNVYCSLDLISDTGQKFQNVDFRGNDLLDAKKFQERLCRLDPSLRLEISNKNFSIFLQEIVIPKFQKRLIIPQNSGVLKQHVFLAGNALIYKGKCIFADENKIIDINKNISIKANDKVSLPLPHIYSSNRSVQEISKELLENLRECWGNNIALAVMPLGHMIMAPFYKLFIIHGVSSLLLWGKSGSGKSTIVKLGLALFGLGKDYLKAGSTTVRSFEDLTYQFNGMNICIDDLDPDLLCSKKFIQVAKSAFEGQARGRLIKQSNNKYSQDSKKAFSQLVYSTNKPIPDVEELRNRMSVYTIMKGAFNEKLFKYFDKDIEITQELSLILPELTKLSQEYVLDLYKRFKQYFSQELGNVEQRIISNLAYDFCGAYIIQQIAEYEIPDFGIKVLDYARDTLESYSEIPTPVDILLNSLVTLKRNGIIIEHQHYKITTKNMRVFLNFHKDTLISTHNKYFTNDATKKIKMNEFNAYLKTDKRFINDLTVRYKSLGGKGMNSVVIDITEWVDLGDFLAPNSNNSDSSSVSSNNS